MFGDLAIRFLQWDSVKTIDVIGMAEHHEHFRTFYESSEFNNLQDSRLCEQEVLCHLSATNRQFNTRELRRRTHCAPEEKRHNPSDGFPAEH